MREERWSGRRGAPGSPRGEKQNAVPPGAPSETRARGKEMRLAGGRTPRYGSHEGQESSWETLKVEAGGGVSGGRRTEKRRGDGGREVSEEAET